MVGYIWSFYTPVEIRNVTSLNYLLFISVPKRKHGKCPRTYSDSVVVCVGPHQGGVKCTSDLDCGGEDLCCNNGCGQICTSPGKCYTSLWGGGG